MAIETLEVAADDPCLDGHFPGEPIVPAVVLLEGVVAAARRCYGARVMCVQRCRFRNPLYPDRPCSIALQEIDDSHLRFVCSDAERELVAGKLRIARDTN